jgi:hypothetical protein
MGGSELNTDSFQRWMMYSKDAYGTGRIFLSTAQKQAVEEGKKVSNAHTPIYWQRTPRSFDESVLFSGRISIGTSAWQRMALTWKS